MFNCSFKYVFRSTTMQNYLIYTEEIKDTKHHILREFICRICIRPEICRSFFKVRQDPKSPAQLTALHLCENSILNKSISTAGETTCSKKERSRNSHYQLSN